MRRLHPRTMEVQAAEAKLGLMLLRIVRKFELTFAETTGILARLIEGQVKYMIREERHGDQSTPGGLESEPVRVEAPPRRLNVSHNTHDFVPRVTSVHSRVWACTKCGMILESPGATSRCAAS